MSKLDLNELQAPLKEKEKIRNDIYDKVLKRCHNRIKMVARQPNTFCYFVVLPIILGFFTSTGPEMMTLAPDISSYLGFVLKLFFAFGVAFEIPVAIMLLCWSGATTTKSLKEKRPYIVVGVFVVAMFLTPPDVLSQTLLAFPMLLLFPRYLKREEVRFYFLVLLVPFISEFEMRCNPK